MELNRSAETSLCVQIATVLSDEIYSGILAVGSKMPGERQLSQRFGTSRGTVIEALRLLAQKGLVRRVPAQGTFVSPRVATSSRILIPFPEKSLSLESLHGNLELWQISNEIKEGVLGYAGSVGSEVFMRHFSEDGVPDELPEATGAVFIGWQLSKLSRLYGERHGRCVRIGGVSLFDNPHELSVSNDVYADFSVLFRHLFSRGFRRFAVIVEDDSHECVDWYVRQKLSVLKKYWQSDREAKSLPSPKLFKVRDLHSSQELGQVADYVESGVGSCAVVCLYTDCLPHVHRCLSERHLLSVHGLAGYGTGIRFTNLYPQVTYVKVAYYQMGYEACRLIQGESFSNQCPIRLIPGSLCLGETTLKGEQA